METKKYYKSLELDKILNLLANEMSCEDSKNLALNLSPASTFDEMNSLLLETSDAHMLTGRFGRPVFGRMKNAEALLKRAISGGLLNMGELLTIAENLRTFRSIVEWKKNSSGVETTLDKIITLIIPNNYLEKKITDSIISEEEMSDTASPELANIRRKIRNASSKIREKLDKMIKSPSYQKYLQDPIVTIKDSRFVVPVKSEYRSEVPGLVHDTSSSGATLFIEPMSIVEANNDIRMLSSKEKLEIERILFELSSEVANFADTISSSYEQAVKLNFIFAKANLAYKMRATTPKTNSVGKILLKKARHPLIDAKRVVPIDINLGINFDTLVITGPNTGGKTVALKTVGLLTLMAMCGLMIPVSDDSEISFFDNVLADVGDEQSIEQSLSTFSAHMINIIKILEMTNTSSLILLDELGAGTDPIEGSALATSILEKIKQSGAKTIATTHYAELKSYAITNNRVENACCEFDISTLCPTYKLLIGVPGKSNAFAISERLGVSHDIIVRAKELVNEENIRFEEVVKSLEDKRTELEKNKLETEVLRNEAKVLKEKYIQQLQQFEKNKDTLMKSSKLEAEKIVSQTRAQAQEILNEISRLRKAGLSSDDKTTLKSQMKKLEQTADPVERKKIEEYSLPRKLKVGDNVVIIDINQKGTVLENQTNSSAILVQAGLIKTRVLINNLRLLEKSEAPAKINPSKQTRNVRSRAESKIVREIDLRGQTALEAIIELDSFIDNAVLAGVNQLTVIHGKGTGVLRREIHQHLKSHPSIKTYRLGVFGEGEAGVTIVELK